MNKFISLHLLITFFFSMFFYQWILAQPSGNPAFTDPKDKSYAKVHIDDLRPISYPYLREADVFWEKRVYREVVFNEKMNQTLYFPENPTSRWRSFMQIIWDALLSGAIIAYDGTNTDNFEEMTPMSIQEIEDRLTTVRMIDIPDPDRPGETIKKETPIPFDPRSVKSIEIKEDWFFDKQRSEMQVRIIGICPLIEDIDPEDGSIRSVMDFLWLYYPNIRQVLAQNEVFNPLNSARRLTFDQFFLQRRFSSYIVKEDNVFDRRINDYATGIDALLEAERIKNEIRDFEQELWSY
jgi:gliding motility associated protien GldN